ncbi:polysaccharide lyase family 8 super-sandwich domain-containing protein [Paenibacillus sp. GD4]|uniref:polysaccharide lyase family 8 super-sandwich domain-containing protein n=1 Tax=Paenibacillus sp. GD4 TaxID=3068890 RepID=UPI002796C9D7|nr:polysaccharide lyase family 8 super-sandwich domain-containing protein [Paenibacillus sp. GD4]MDQ1914819.1 polysaccharide lyase family 8 super-sandwich domain-containing protein [Paenibacillus sp. GD4]
MFKKNVFKTIHVAIIIAMLSFLVIPSFAVEAIAAEETNLISNGGFETTVTTTRNKWVGNIEPVGWTEWYASGSGKAAIDRTIVHEGSNSVRIEHASASRTAISGTFTVTPGQRYKLGIWIKTDNVVAANGVFARTQYLDSSGKKVGDGPATAKLSGTNDWILKETFMTIPAGAAKLKIEPFFETGTGNVWFDEVTLVKWDGLTGLDLDRDFISIGKDQSIKLNPIYTPADAPDKSVNWTSTNPDVAVVADGVVTGKSYGTTVIKVATMDGRLTAQCVIGVESPDMLQAYDTLRGIWYDKLVGGGRANTADPDIAAYVTALAAAVSNPERTGRWDRLNQSADRTYLWSDLTSVTDSAQISTAYGALRTMSLAYSIPGSPLYRNESLRNDIVGALDWMYANRYNEKKTEYGNWWDWEIGTPQIVNDIMVLMYDHLTADQLNNYMKPIDRFVRDPKVRAINGVKETGANLLDKAFVVSLRGIIGKLSAKIVQGRDAIGPEFVYATKGDGVYKDGSLVQHFNIAYTGGYGAVWLNRAADMMLLLNGSPWTVSDPNVNNVYDWVADTFEPIIYKGQLMDMVNGRGISRQTAGSARGIIMTILRLAESAPADKAVSIKRMVKEWIRSDTTYINYVEGLPIYEMSLVKKLMSDSSIEPRGELVKHQVFAGMDRIVHLRPGFGFGISMFSDRISAFEYGNGENGKGWYTGIGMTSLYNNDLTQFRQDFWPTVDSYRLPGTTTDGSYKTPKDWAAYMNPKDWVGGSSIDGLYGAAGMHFSLEQSTGSTLQGKKSWFSFDDEIVAIGSGITGTDNRKTETIVENRKLNGIGDNALTVNGARKPAEPGWSEKMDNVKWAHLSGSEANSDIGYYFPEATTIAGLREARTGAWKDINSGGSPAPVTRNYLSLAFDHGVNPTDASYAYVLLPGKDAASTEVYSESPNIAILSQTQDVHAAKEAGLGITAANFWNAGTVDGLTAYSPASVMLKESNGTVTLAVSDPTQKQRAVTIELNKAELSVVGHDATIEVVQTSPTMKLVVNTAGSIGKSHVITFRDSVAPTTTDDAKAGWQASPQTVKLTAADHGSGIAETLYRVNHGVYAKGTTISLGTEGVHSIEYYSVDRAGNQETIKSATVKLDMSGPTIEPTVSLAVYRTASALIRFAVTDSLSGIANVSFKLDGAEMSEPLMVTPLSLASGRHTIQATASDQAGNVTAREFTLEVMMDIDHLGELIRYGGEQGWIGNPGVSNSLLSKVDHIHKARSDAEQVQNGLKALQNEIEAQAGKHMDALFARKLLDDIAYLKKK